VVGVAGIMGAGKSTVARVFRDLGAAVIDADSVGKDLLKDRKIREAIVEAFGKKVTGPNGDVDAAKLGEAAFSSADAATRLDEITRSALIERLKAEVAGLSESAGVIVVDAALLPEWNSRDWIDVLVVVDSCEKDAVSRSCEGSRFKAPNVRARMKHQYSRKEKSREADIILPNYGSLEELKERARKMYMTLVQVSGTG
jgi:dephospho-CoA kinase